MYIFTHNLWAWLGPHLFPKRNKRVRFPFSGLVNHTSEIRRAGFIIAHYWNLTSLFCGWFLSRFIILTLFTDVAKHLPPCSGRINANSSGIYFIFSLHNYVTAYISIKTTPICVHILITDATLCLFYLCTETFASSETLKTDQLSLTWDVPISYPYIPFLNYSRTRRIESTYFKIRNVEDLEILSYQCKKSE